MHDCLRTQILSEYGNMSKLLRSARGLENFYGGLGGGGGGADEKVVDFKQRS